MTLEDELARACWRQRDPLGEEIVAQSALRAGVRAEHRPGLGNTAILEQAPFQTVRGYEEWKNKVANPAIEEFFANSLSMDDLGSKLVDESNALPRVQRENDDAESGRGLLLMEQLVHDWGVRPLNEEGKITWARCAR